MDKIIDTYEELPLKALEMDIKKFGQELKSQTFEQFAKNQD
jgi:hypothetical protein